MRRFLFTAVLALAACATSAVPARVPEALRGCWIERRGEDTVTMRWFPKDVGVSWHGDELFYRRGEEPAHQGFDIDAAAGENEQFGWAICPLDDGMPHGPPCRPVFFGQGHVPGEGADWMEINVTAEHMSLVNVIGGERSTLFNGVRDGCD